MTQKDWRAAIHAHAARAGVELTPQIVDELAEHLEDLHAAADRAGCTDAEADARVEAALHESTIELLQAKSASQARQSVASSLEVPSPGGRHLHMAATLRQAARQLRLHPGFATITILVLALGVGATTTVVTIVNSVLLRPLPYPQPDRLVTLWDTNVRRGLAHEPISPVNFTDYRALPVFERAAAWWRPSLNLVDPGVDPMRVNAVEVSGNFFEVMGVRPQLGQGFPSGGAFFVPNEPMVVLSDRLWRARYHADRAIVGRMLEFNGVPHLVAGVMPQTFNYPIDVDVWQRLTWDLTRHTRAAHFMEAVLRLKNGTTFDEATVAARTLARRLAIEFSGTNTDWGVALVPLIDEALGYYRPALLVLVGAVGLVLVIVCLNVASLLLTRALARERDVAVRIAMGASPRQLAVQSLAEAFVLSAAGAIVGVLAAIAVLPALVAMAPPGIPRLGDARIDLTALAVASALSMITTIVFGLVPAIVLTRRAISLGLRSGERGNSRGARRAYSVIVAGQVALAGALLVSSALLIRTVMQMVNTPTGVRADDVVTTSIQLPIALDFGRPFNATAFLNRARTIADTHELMLERIRQQPGVIAAGAASALPIEIGWRLPFQLDHEDVPVRPDDRRMAQYHVVSDGYFESMGASMAAGRSFTAHDTSEAAPIVVVNETFVTRYLAGPAALGHSIATTTSNVGPLGLNMMVSWENPVQAPPPRQFEIVGVVRDVRDTPLGQPVEPAIYFTSQQFPFRALFYVVRATGPDAAITAIRKALALTAPGVPTGSVLSWSERLSARTAEPRLLMVLLMFFGATAALLAAMGVYGLFSWPVAQRTQELAIRLTLGARPLGVGASVIRQSLVLVAAGLATGFLIVRLSEAMLARVLFQLSPRDPVSMLMAGALLLVVALGACVPPAVTALRVDPVEGLRAE